MSPWLHWTGQSGKHLLYEQCDPVPLQHTGAQGLFPRSVAFSLMRIATFHMVICLTQLYVFCCLFSDRAFESEINCTNPLGTGGRLAIGFAVLLRALWKGTHHAFQPSKLKVSMKQQNCC